MPVKGLVELLERLLRVDEVLEPSPLDELLFVALPAGSVNEVVIEGPVLVRMLQVQRARFDRALNVEEEQGLIEGDAELAVLVDSLPFFGVQETDGCRFIDRAVFFFEMLNGVH